MESIRTGRAGANGRGMSIVSGRDRVVTSRSLVLAAPATGAGDSAWLGFGLGVQCGAAVGVAAGAAVGLIEPVAADS